MFLSLVLPPGVAKGEGTIVGPTTYTSLLHALFFFTYKGVPLLF